MWAGHKSDQKLGTVKIDVIQMIHTNYAIQCHHNNTRTFKKIYGYFSTTDIPAPKIYILLI